MSETFYARAGNVLWRAGPDRVLVRTVNEPGAELFGAAAVVWLALDGPRSIADLEHEIAPLLDVPVDVGATLDALVAERLVEVSPGPAPASGHDR